MSRRMRVSAAHMVENLGSGLYESPGACSAELWRNGAVACMPGEKWQPGKDHVEISLTDHPLAPKTTAMIFLDHGKGFTDPALDRFCFIGPSITDLEELGYGTHSGAAQKRIGRFAGLALNEKCLHGPLRERIKHGFYILTRTEEVGRIRLVSMIPELLEREDNLPERWVSPTATEMGHLKGIKGSFSAIVIPDPVFKTEQEIREALQWLIPRKRDLLGKLMIGSRSLHPPKLPQITVSSGDMEAYFDLAESEDRKSGGIWLTDAHTGLRVARLPELVSKVDIAYPVWRHELVGDIFIPDLLQHQNTARSGLNKEFANKRNAAWRKISMFMLSQIAPRAKELLGDDDVFTQGPITETLQDIIQMLQDAYGVPAKKVIEVVDVPPAPPHVSKSGNGGGQGGKRVYHIQLGGKKYALFTSRHLEPSLFASIYAEEPERMYLNTRGYEAMPLSKMASREHVLMRILEAAALDQNPGDPFKAQMFIGERRKELLTKLLQLKEQGE